MTHQFIDNMTIRELLNLDDLIIHEYSRPIRLDKCFSIGNTDIRLTVIFPNYECNDAFDYKLDNNLYELYIEGPGAEIINGNYFRGDIIEVRRLLKQLSDLIFRQDVKPWLLMCPDNVKNLLKKYSRVHIRKTNVDSDGAYKVCVYDAGTNQLLLLTSNIKEFTTRANGYVTFRTSNSLYGFQLT